MNCIVVIVWVNMMRLEREHDIKKAEPMEVFVGERYLLGHKAILEGLSGLLAEATAARYNPEPTGSAQGSDSSDPSDPSDPTDPSDRAAPAGPPPSGWRIGPATRDSRD